jgi:hypothetical protein
MNDTEKYLTSLYQPSDRIGILLMRKNERAIQHIMTVAEILKPGFQNYLHRANERESLNIFHSVATVKPGHTRQLQDIVRVPCGYIDVDKDGPKRLAEVLNSAEVPRPNWITQTSPGHYQMTWRMEGWRDLDEASRFMRGLALKFGGDPQGVELTQTLRLPGYLNVKAEHPERPKVELIEHAPSDRVYSPNDFRGVRLDIQRLDWQRTVTREISQEAGHALDYRKQFARVLSELRGGMDREIVERNLTRSYEAIGVSAPALKARRDVERASRKVELGFSHAAPKLERGYSYER